MRDIARRQFQIDRPKCGCVRSRVLCTKRGANCNHRLYRCDIEEATVDPITECSHRQSRRRIHPARLSKRLKARRDVDAHRRTGCCFHGLKRSLRSHPDSEHDGRLGVLLDSSNQAPERCTESAQLNSVDEMLPNSTNSRWSSPISFTMRPPWAATGWGSKTRSLGAALQ